MSYPVTTLYKGTLDHKLIYLFGTLHLSHDAIIWDEEKICSCIKDVDYYFSELNLEHSQETLYVHQMLPAGKIMSDYIGTRKYSKYKAVLEKHFDLDLDDYCRLKPILFHNILSAKIADGSAEPLDFYLWEKAGEYGVVRSGLESLDDQIKVLNGIDLEFQFRKFNHIMGYLSKYRKHTKALIRDYNEKKLKNLHIKAIRSLGQYKRWMLYDRNRRMAEKLEQASHQRIFVAIGAGHLWGNEGVIAILKRKGFTFQSNL